MLQYGYRIINSFYIFIAVLCLLHAPTLIADEGTEKSSVQKLSVLQTRIEEKTPGMISCDGERYRISKSTKIVNPSGTPMTFEQMPVPCNATVYYEIVIGQQAIVHRITITEVDWDAVTEWTKPKPH